MKVEILRRQVIRDYKIKNTALSDNGFILYYTILIDDIKHHYLVDYVDKTTALISATATENMYSVKIGSAAMNNIVEPYAIHVIIDIDRNDPAKAIDRYRKLVLLK